ncbi:hypothetical protein [Flavobacterium sp. SM2513]|uniref:hypothetical protein n=1 Tax=Flavobacterium sp. SM2513 TaxID=3424766 RepID=UPI003D7FBE03
MKKLIVVALLSLTISGMAQDKKKRMNEERPEFTAQQQNELQVKKLTLELDLTAKQQKEISEIIAKQQEKREAAKTALKNKKEDSKKLTPDEKFVLKRNMLDNKIAQKEQMKKVLTAEQLEKWEKISKQNKKRFAERKKRKAQVEK